MKWVEDFEKYRDMKTLISESATFSSISLIIKVGPGMVGNNIYQVLVIKCLVFNRFFSLSP